MDVYANQNADAAASRERVRASTSSGILDINDDITRNLNAQTVFNVNDIKLGKGLSLHGLVGNAIQDNKSTVDGSEGTNFLDPNFISINNTGTKYSRTVDLAAPARQRLRAGDARTSVTTCT